MRKKRRITLFMFVALILAAVAWLTFSSPSPLVRPVLDGKPIGHWLEQMAVSGVERDRITDRLVAAGPAVLDPLLAALKDRPSSLRLKFGPFLATHFPQIY
jgi:hypothetical protein